MKAAVVHLDCDGVTEIFRAHGWEPRGDYATFTDDGLARALEFFDDHEVHATLFVIAAALSSPSRRRFFRDAIARGHEIASHTLTHRPLTSLSRAEKRREIADSRAAICDALGTAVAGFRAPNFAIDLESLDYVEEAGYAWDSSLFAGPQRGPLGPLGVVADSPGSLRGRGLMELPMPRRGVLPFPFHPSYSLVLGHRYFRAGLALGARREAPLVMLFHLSDFAQPLSRAELPGWRSRFFTHAWLSAAEKRRRCDQMLEAVRRRYALCATRALVQEAAGA